MTGGREGQAEPLRILLLGATGLIGSAVAARLAAEGHEVVGVARRLDSAARRMPAARWIQADLRTMVRPEAWLPHLAGVDAVVNCAGTLQASLRDSPGRVHRDAPSALWRACEQAGIRRIVQLSAIGVDRGGVTDFSRTKSEGDGALVASGLDWIILRPSVRRPRPRRLWRQRAVPSSRLAPVPAAHPRGGRARRRPARRRGRNGGATASPRRASAAGAGAGRTRAAVLC